ncbi:cyclic nucleotide-binding domain-containing protein 2-like [Haliotis rufescens]|uniref:cyclic nucleotide-binding domain-containing protein 2-like n=1 Tax=Haliotis rufescens TaxID=6454 RepID=UPI001EB06F8D|nr:cyclic nucleotide-binding domain-containing protein 2-like [Haliotis rufescens]
MSLEQGIAAGVSGGKSDPPESDLAYYSQPENYTGTNFQALQRFVHAKSKEERSDRDDGKKKKRKKGVFCLFRRYRHLLPKELDDLADESSSSEEEEAKDVTKEGEGKDEEKKEEKREEKKEEEQPQSRPTSALLSPDLVSVTIHEEPSAEMRETISPLSSAKVRPAVDVPSPSGTSMDSDSPDSIGVSADYSRISVNKKRSAVLAGHRPSTALMRANANKMAKEVRAKMVRDKFIKAVKLMMIMRNIASMISQKAGEGGRPQTFTDMAGESDDSNMKNSGLSFDPSYFKARKEISISNEVKHILSLPSDERSSEQVQTAMFGLQSLRSFAEYPLHMQEKLAKVAWYEVIPPKRIIIRQGHYAENFYFILSGQAVVTILIRDPKTGGSVVRTATIMRKGMSFGELALLHRSRRTATVTSQDTVQLLTIGRVDFFEIFMAGSGPDDIPDHIKFVSQCEFMKDWPIEKLLERPEMCLLHFFKRNVVIVKDSRVSDWLYVVKSGSCQVLKHLRGVTPRIGIPKKELECSEGVKLPNLVTGEQRAKVDTGLKRRKRALPKLMPPTDAKDAEDAAGNKENTAHPGQGRFSKFKYMQRPDTRKAHFSVTEKRRLYEIPKKNLPPPPPPVEVKDTNTGPLFVQVDHLKPRDSFGLTSIQFDDDIERPSTSVSLVSRGAECIMLSKDFFAKHANELVKQCVRQQLRPYPAEETFQENLQNKVDWDLYKQVMIEDLTTPR